MLETEGKEKKYRVTPVQLDAKRTGLIMLPIGNELAYKPMLSEE